MTTAATVEWKTCLVEGCPGARSGSNEMCLAHLALSDLALELERIATDGTVDARGVEISSDLLRRILNALPRIGKRRPCFAEADFEGTIFTGPAWFESVTFGSEARFPGARFEDHVSFREARFEGDAWFDDAIFQKEAHFDGAVFGGSTAFGGATFSSGAWFSDAKFTGEAFFGATFEAGASFARDVFRDDAWFEDARFDNNAGFSDAIFRRGGAFNGATFKEAAVFAGAKFGGEAGFVDATFGRLALFGNNAIFRGPARFLRASFAGEASFDGADFRRDADFSRATFTSTWFGGASFAREARFHRATFGQGARFDETTFHRTADFGRATFEHARRFGPILALGTLRLDSASFLEAADVQISANRLSLVQARFPDGTRIWTRFAEIDLERATFGASSILASSAEFRGLDDSELTARLEADAVRSARPRLLSLRWASVENLTVSGVDLSCCRFFGAHHLDGLRLEGGSSFALTPADYRVTRRQSIAEEHEWRSSHPTRLSAPGWYPSECRLSETGSAPPLEAPDIATIYRDLRKGRESNRDEPGAADFYYGEMEMRRLTGGEPGGGGDERAAGRPPGRITRDRGERLILTLYWLVSGYGLRASRALAALVATVIVFGVLLYAFGFRSDESLLGALTFSAESTTSLFRAELRPLTIAGEWLQIGLRMLGPLFFGLTLLSLRGRIKR